MLLSYLLGFIFCAVCTYYAIKQMDAYAVTVAVLWGAFLAKPILELLLLVYGWFRDAPLRPFQGKYYAFDYHQVRVVEINNALWIVDEDILPLIGLVATEAARRLALPSEHRYVAADKLWVYSEQATMQLLQNSQHANANRLALWIQREVYFPYRKKAHV